MIVIAAARSFRGEIQFYGCEHLEKLDFAFEFGHLAKLHSALTYAKEL